jgi:Tfp pilus assembly protein PilO
MLKLQAFYTILGRLSKREKFIFYCALLIVSITLLDRLIIYPIFSKLNLLNKEIKEKEAGIRKNLHILAHKDRILAESTKYSSFLSSLKSEEEEMTSILKEIESLADKTSIYLIDMKPGGLKDMGTSKKYLVNLNCEAQMEQLVNFIYSIESSNKLLTVDKYQISPKSRESSIARCRITISKVVVP